MKPFASLLSRPESPYIHKMARIVLDQVTKVFANGVRGVSGLCLEAADGEITGIVGASGSGKTTTLRVIAGLEAPDSGTVSIGNRVVNQISPPARDVAMVFQRPALYPHLTVRRNLDFSLRLRRT